MFCLVYQSKVNPLFGVTQIQEMLLKARTFNQHNKITGCLLFYHEHFIQYIEGDKAKIVALYESIQNDIRHSDVTLLSFSEINAREFGTWDMVYENLSSQSIQLQYLNLLVGSFIDDKDTAMRPNPTSIDFWNATKKLLEIKGRLDYS